MRTFIINLIIFFVVSLSAVNAADYYVSTSGSDGSGDGSSGNPWATIQHAIDQVSANDVIHVGDGTYNLSSPITVDKALTLTGNTSNPSNVVINAPTSGGDDRDVIQVIANNVTIEGFKVQGAKDVDGGGVGRTNSGIVVGGDYYILGSKPTGATDFTFASWWAIDASNVTIRNNICTDNSYGIFLFHCQNVTVENNEIFSNSQDIDTWSGKGIVVYTSRDMADDDLADGGTALQATNDITINSNSVYDNDLFGIELNHSEAYNGGGCRTV